MGFVSSAGYSEQTEHYFGTEFVGRLNEDKTIICGIYTTFFSIYLEDNVIKSCLSSAHNNYLEAPQSSSARADQFDNI